MRKTSVDVETLPAILTLERVAELAQVKPRTVRDWVRKSRLKAGRMHGGGSAKLYFNTKEVLRLLGVEDA